MAGVEIPWWPPRPASGRSEAAENQLTGVTVQECEALKSEVEASGLTLQVGTQRRFDEGIAHARDFISHEIGEVLSMRAWYCDSTHRYATTDAVQPLILSSKAAVRPEGDPKAERRSYYLLGHASHLVDTARLLCGDIVSLRAQLVEKFGAFSWFQHSLTTGDEVEVAGFVGAV